MRKLKLLTILYGMTVPLISVFAEQGTPQKGNQQPIVLKRVLEQSYNKVPKTPDAQVITCVYEEGILTLSFTLSEGWADLTVSDENQNVNFYNFDSSQLNVSIQMVNIHGEMDILLETELGNAYNGIIK